MGALGLAINMRPSYPHLTSLDYIETLSLWWFDSCSEHASTRYDSMPRQWYGTPIEAWVRLDPFAQGWSGGSHPSFSLLFLIYLLYPYLMLTLGSSSNNYLWWGVFNDWLSDLCWLRWWTPNNLCFMRTRRLKKEMYNKSWNRLPITHWNKFYQSQTLITSKINWWAH